MGELVLRIGAQEARRKNCIFQTYMCDKKEKRSQ